MLILAMGLLSCRSSHVVRGDGLKHIRLGAPMPTPTNQQLRRVPTRDSLMREGGYEWMAKILDYEQGEVWVESDFFGEDKVNRIRIETPELYVKAPDKLRVGSTVAEMKAMHQRWQVEWLAEYGYYDVIDPTYLHVHYLISAPTRPPERPSLATSPTPPAWRC